MPEKTYEEWLEAIVNLDVYLEDVPRDILTNEMTTVAIDSGAVREIHAFLSYLPKEELDYELIHYAISEWPQAIVYTQSSRKRRLQWQKYG